MDHFRRCTRSRRNGPPGPQQPQSTAELPAAVRKLQSMPGFVHKAGPSKKVVLRESPSPKKIRKSTVTAAEETKPCDDHFRFIGETAALRELISESAICKNCKKGTLEVSFVNRGVSTEIHTKCTTCEQWCSSSVVKTKMAGGESKEWYS
jgi:hypothetical protein